MQQFETDRHIKKNNSNGYGEETLFHKYTTALLLWAVSHLCIPLQQPHRLVRSKEIGEASTVMHDSKIL